jgi:hypothetical protein
MHLMSWHLHLQLDGCHSSERGERQHVVVLAATNFPWDIMVHCMHSVYTAALFARRLTAVTRRRVVSVSTWWCWLPRTSPGTSCAT